MTSTGKPKQANNSIMYDRIRNTWSYVDLLSMYETNKAFGDSSYFLFSKDLKHVWLISWTNSKKGIYDAYLTEGEFIRYLALVDDLTINKIAKLLGIAAVEVYESINSTDLLGNGTNLLGRLLPTVGLVDVFNNDEELSQLVKTGNAKQLDKKRATQSKPYCALDVANYLVQHFINRGTPINNMLLQKMLYYLQADSLRLTGKPLFKESMEKWGYGAAQPIVYSYFKSYGAAPITNTTDYVGTNDDNTWQLIKHIDRRLQVEDIKAINSLADEIYYEYHNHPYQLVIKAHHEPMWKEDEAKIRKGNMHIPYDNEEIRKYFSQPDNWKWRN